MKPVPEPDSTPFAAAPHRGITTSNIYPPIPFRGADWVAYYDGQEESGRYGHGATEDAAIADLLDNFG